MRKTITMNLRHTARIIVFASSGLIACTAVQEEVKPTVVKPVSQTAKADGPKESFAQGVAAFDSGNFEQAKTLFSRVAAAAPNNLQTQYNLGVIAARQGDLKEAVARYETAHRLDAKHKPTLLNLGKVYRLQDKFAEAIALYEEALKDPANEYDVELNNNLTVAYRLAKKYDRAEATARKVLARTKSNADAYKNLSLIYFDQGNYRLAEFISANAKKLDASDPGVYNNLGLIYLKLDDRRLALGQFQKAVSLNKDFAPSLFNMGAIALSYRDYPNAERSLSRAAELDPTSYESFLAYAYSLDGQKGRDPKKGVKAGETFEKVLSLKADQPEAICGAAWAYAADKSGWDRALQYFERCKKLSSTTAQDQQAIDVKMKGIVAMQKSGQPAAPAEAAKEKPKTAPSGSSMLDKVSDDAAAKEATTPAAPDAAPPAPAKP